MNRRVWMSLVVVMFMSMGMSLASAAVVVKSSDKPEETMTKNDLLAKAYQDGLVVAYLDAGGKMKMLSARNGEEMEKAKQKVLQDYDKKKAAYDKGSEAYLKKNPDMKYSQSAPVEPSFKTVEANVVRQGDRIRSVTPKENFYAVYKVESDGETTYEAGYDFSEVLQKQKHERKYIQKYNAWVRAKKEGEEPAAPKYEKVVGELSKNMAAKAQADFSAWRKKHAAWEKSGQKGEAPQQPEADKYKAASDPEGHKPAEGRRN